MDIEQIIQWAREAGMVVHEGAQDRVLFDGSIVDSLNRFAKLVAAHEREALLDLVDNYAKNNTDLKAAIRARK